MLPVCDSSPATAPSASLPLLLIQPHSFTLAGRDATAADKVLKPLLEGVKSRECLSPMPQLVRLCVEGSLQRPEGKERESDWGDEGAWV